MPDIMPDGLPWPKISIVTPSYNQGQFVEETIRSVLLQGYPNLEYIVIDGGSTDNSVEIIRKYEPWLTSWVSEKDRGQSHAINKGFALSTGEIMAWLNSDDVYFPATFQLVGSTLAGREMTVLVGSAIVTDGPEELTGCLDYRKPSFAEMAYNVKTYPQPSVFWTRDTWQKACGLKEELHYLMDYDMWLRMLGAGASVECSSQVLAYERTHPRQKSANNTITANMYFEQRIEVALTAAQQRGEHPFYWLMRVWGHRIRKTCSSRHWPILYGEGFHRQACRAVMSSLFSKKKGVR